MKLTITLPSSFQTKDIRTLLEEDWLIPRKVRHFLRVRKNVQVNGSAKLFHETVTAGDEVTLSFEENDYPVPDIALGDADKAAVLFEDDHLIIVNKPHGIKTHPNQPDETDTLLNHIAAYLAPSGSSPYVVHRLDKETSGAVLFAKNPVVLPLLGRRLERKEIQRIYEAEVAGIITEPALTITKKIGRHRHDRRKRVVDEQHGKPAVTYVTVTDRSHQSTWVSCRLETGRTHQIRVHLQAIGHPVIGDPLYQQNAPANQRLMLHARELSLQHPFTLEPITVRTALGLKDMPRRQG